MPVDVGKIRDFQTRFHIYTVPGQMALQASRKIILRGVDGIVFVADSQKDRREDNLQALEDLKQILLECERDPLKLPMAIQYNKRDVENSLSLKELRSDLNLWNKPDFEAQASKGVGVFETLTSISKAVVSVLKGGDIV